MAQHYCDSTKLERDWFHWLLATALPELEPFRRAGLLWTRLECTPDQSPDPRCPDRLHCVALESPIFFRSRGATIGDAVVYGESGSRVCTLPTEDDLRLDNPEYRCGLPFLQQGVLVPWLRLQRFLLERPAAASWEATVLGVQSICTGVVKKFDLQSEEARQELANDVLRQLLQKLVSRRLVYTPGRAPVFNLLTTTVYRCIYSILNRSNRQRSNHQRLLTEICEGQTSKVLRSFRISGQTPIRSH